MRCFVLVAVFTALACSPAGAQVTTSLPPDTAGCGRAETVALGSGSRQDADRALARLSSCDAGRYGSVLARRLLRNRAVADRAAAEELWRRTRWIRDRSVYRASLAVAADPNASVPVRVFALRALAIQLSPSQFISRYEDMVQTPPVELAGVRGHCRFAPTTGGFAHQGEPLPADFAKEIERVVSRIEASPSEPVDVRAAAWCTLHHY